MPGSMCCSRHLGWVGFDPTNNLVAHHRHIRTAIGRDYRDVPPTHGVFRGKTESELYVAVHVEAGDQPPALDHKLPIPEDWSVLVESAQQPPDQTCPHRANCNKCSSSRLICDGTCKLMRTAETYEKYIESRAKSYKMNGK